MRIVLVLALCPSFALAQSAQQLAQEPEAIVEKGWCHITGALWRNGPLSHTSLSLVEQDGVRAFQTQTDEKGIYRISVPVSKRTLFRELYRERGSIKGTQPLVYCVKATVEVGAMERVE